MTIFNGNVHAMLHWAANNGDLSGEFRDRPEWVEIHEWRKQYDRRLLELAIENFPWDREIMARMSSSTILSPSDYLRLAEWYRDRVLPILESWDN